MSNKREKDKNMENGKMKQKKKKIVFNRVGLHKERHELVLFDINTPVFTFDFRKDLNLIYDPNYEGKVIPFKSKEYRAMDEKTLIHYDEIRSNGKTIWFFFKGKRVYFDYLQELINRAEIMWNINFACEINDDDYEEPHSVKGYILHDWCKMKGDGEQIFIEDWEIDGKYCVLYSKGKKVTRVNINRMLHSYLEGRYKFGPTLIPWLD